MADEESRVKTSITYKWELEISFDAPMTLEAQGILGWEIQKLIDNFLLQQIERTAEGSPSASEKKFFAELKKFWRDHSGDVEVSTAYDR